MTPITPTSVPDDHPGFEALKVPTESSALSDPPMCSVSADLERSLTAVAKAILRLKVPKSALAEGEIVDRAGYWLLLHASQVAPVRLSDLAEVAELDLSTVSRQMSDLVGCNLVLKIPDPNDGRASLLSLSERGWAVLAAVSEARRRALAKAITGWSDEERSALARGVLRLESGLQNTKESQNEERTS